MNASSKTLLLGSCFAGSIGTRMLDEGRDTLVNPFGTIFNPASIASSMERLADKHPFTEEECVMMGAGAGLWGSFNHYTKFARPTKEEFLLNANKQLEKAAEYYEKCDRIILTFGTAWCWRHKATEENSRLLSSLFPRRPKIVSNCLKIPQGEFSRERLDVNEIVAMYKSLSPILLGGNGKVRPKQVVLTVSPIRHLMDGEHANTVSKAILHLAVDRLCSTSAGFSYFPAYEMMIDTLRDYSWYAQDNVHPSEQAADTIWKAFKQWENTEHEKH